MLAFRRFAKVHFLHVNGSPKLPWMRVISHMISTEVENQFHNKNVPESSRNKQTSVNFILCNNLCQSQGNSGQLIRIQ